MGSPAPPPHPGTRPLLPGPDGGARRHGPRPVPLGSRSGHAGSAGPLRGAGLYPRPPAPPTASHHGQSTLQGCSTLEGSLQEGKVPLATVASQRPHRDRDPLEGLREGGEPPCAAGPCCVRGRAFHSACSHGGCPVLPVPALPYFLLDTPLSGAPLPRPAPWKQLSGLSALPERAPGAAHNPARERNKRSGSSSHAVRTARALRRHRRGDPAEGQPKASGGRSCGAAPARPPRRRRAPGPGRRTAARRTRGARRLPEAGRRTDLDNAAPELKSPTQRSHGWPFSGARSPARRPWPPGDLAAGDLSETGRRKPDPARTDGPRGSLPARLGSPPRRVQGGHRRKADQRLSGPTNDPTLPGGRMTSPTSRDQHAGHTPRPAQSKAGLWGGPGRGRDQSPGAALAPKHTGTLPAPLGSWGLTRSAHALPGRPLRAQARGQPPSPRRRALQAPSSHTGRWALPG